MGIVIHSYGKRWRGKYSSLKFPPFEHALDVLDHVRGLGVGAVTVSGGYAIAVGAGLSRAVVLSTVSAYCQGVVHLTGAATLAELVQVTDQPNLAFIPCGPLPPNPAELLARFGAVAPERHLRCGQGYAIARSYAFDSFADGVVEEPALCRDRKSVV